MCSRRTSPCNTAGPAVKLILSFHRTCQSLLVHGQSWINSIPYFRNSTLRLDVRQSDSLCVFPQLHQILRQCLKLGHHHCPHYQSFDAWKPAILTASLQKHECINKTQVPSQPSAGQLCSHDVNGKLHSERGVCWGRAAWVRFQGLPFPHERWKILSCRLYLNYYLSPTFDTFLWSTWGCIQDRKLLCRDISEQGSPTTFRKGPQLFLWTGSRAARVKITVCGTPNRLNWVIIHSMEFYYKNATLLYYANCLNKRKYYLDKNLKHKSISLSRCCQGHAVLPSGWVAWIYYN
jgi:hypothetical protein